MDISRRKFIKASAAAAALASAGLPVRALADEQVVYGRAQCRFCGTGCTVQPGVRNGRVVAIKGDPDSPINHGHLCQKGYALPHIMYGSDRLTSPQVRQADGSYKNVSWNTALDLIADKFVENIKQHGVDSVAWYGSGQNTTQEAFAANKLFKGIIGTANVEGNPRLCMASAVGGYLNSFGADEPAGSYDDFDYSDCFFIIGANPAEAHPVLFQRLMDRRTAHPDRVKVIVADPRFSPTASFADLHLQLRPGYDMHLLNAMAYVLVSEGMIDREHLDHLRFRKGLKTKGEFTDFAAYAKSLEAYAPEKVADQIGVPAADIRTAARWFGRDKHTSLSLWTMGMNQRTQGVHLNCQLHNLHLVSGKIGHPGSDSLSLTGQPNACGGTREQGGLTHILPGHRAVANPRHRAEMAEIWGVPVEWLPTKPTGPAVNMFQRLETQKIHCIWINTTNPGQSLPNAARYRKAMQKAFTVVSDIYPTRTTELASVILPSAMWVEREGVMGQTDRRSQITPKLVEPPRGCRTDFWQIREIARRIAERLGRQTAYRHIDPLTGKVLKTETVYGLGFGNEEEAWNEYRLATRHQDVDLWGATYEKLKAHAGGVAWPCPSTDFDNRGSAKRYISKEHAQKTAGATTRKYATGYVTLYDQHMAEREIAGEINYYGGHPFHKGAEGKAIVRVLGAMTDFEMPDADYPFVLNTGRTVEHWHTGTMTMRVPRLKAISPAAYVEVSQADAATLKLRNGSQLKIGSRRGEIVLPVWVTERAQKGMVFVPWFDENKLINRLTVDAPKSWSGAGEPDYKVCAVRIEKV